MVPKVLCIEDHPEEPFGKFKLQKHLETMFDNKFPLLIEKDPELAYELVKQDDDIQVVLLDIEFGEDNHPLGREIAVTLQVLRPDIRIIVLTTRDKRGEKIRFGQQKNVFHYFVKMELGTSTGPTRLQRITTALLEDPFNERWQITLDYEGEAVQIKNSHLNVNVELPVTDYDHIHTLQACLKTPGNCININTIVDPKSKRSLLSEGFSLARVVSAINERFTKEVHHYTWGFLNSKLCANNAVKIFVGEQEEEISQSSLERIEALEKRVAELEARGANT